MILKASLKTLISTKKKYSKEEIVNKSNNIGTKTVSGVSSVIGDYVILDSDIDKMMIEITHIKDYTFLTLNDQECFSYS